ncbi:MAG: family 10 glycosylhydrolase [candidate division KSB1 bacterium]|nr:family 10 glycosylhydrolase [candidate division KSB1 bacterium]
MKQTTSFNSPLKGLLSGLLFLLNFSLLCEKPFTGKREARGVWVTRWEYTTSLNTRNAAVQQQKIIEIMKSARRAKLNMVFFQVRGQADACYPSHFEPWAAELTDTLGKDPGWDPLQFAIEQAHRFGLELHAWFNTFTAWRGQMPPPATRPEHIYNAHPEWLCADSAGVPMSLNSHYVFVSPGIPEVREHVHQVAIDIVRNYNVDGIHFDYIRYPEKSNTRGYSHDSISVRRFHSLMENPQGLSWEDWQREQINLFVRRFYEEATALKPMVKISAAVIGKYDWSQWNGYHAVFQDARQWLEEGNMDFLVPMIYWRRHHPEAPFGKIAREWLEKYSYHRYIFPGINARKDNLPDWPEDELERQVEIIRHRNGRGMVFFSYSALERHWENLGAADQLVINFPKGFTYLANVPPMPWKDSHPPRPPRNLRVLKVSPDSIVIAWQPSLPASDGDSAEYYNVYRSTRTPVDISTAANLLAITATADTVFVDREMGKSMKYYYLVTALDDGDNESLASNEVEAIIPAVALADGRNHH